MRLVWVEFEINVLFEKKKIGIGHINDSLFDKNETVIKDVVKDV